MSNQPKNYKVLLSTVNPIEIIIKANLRMALINRDN